MPVSFAEVMANKLRKPDPMAASVMSRPSAPEWQPEYEKEPPLEAPMFAPDDLIGSGIPTKTALLIKALIGGAKTSAPLLAGLGVIKPKGGNWLSGPYGVEKKLSTLHGPDQTLDDAKASVQWLQNNRPEQDPEVTRQVIAQLNQRTWPTQEVATQNKALNAFINNQLTKYVKNDLAAPTDPIRKLADTWQAEKATKLADAEAKIKALRTKQEAQAATRGVPEEYLTRTRQEVLAAEEARDLIAENTGLHYKPPPQAEQAGEYTQLRRKAEGFPEEGMATTDMGRAWENLSDRTVSPQLAKNFQLERNLRQDPWLAKVDPQAKINTVPDNVAYDLHLGHLTDELSNSLFEGRLTPEQLAKMPIDQAVRHVAEINALRAVNSKKERAMEMAGMPVHKEYPEQGMSWRQLKHEDEPTLQKWLTQEGDAMAHCVGGYCPDVLEGRSNIFSLRDAKGQPHVTIETSGKPIDDPRDWYSNAQEAEELNFPAVLPDTPEYLQAIRQSPEYQAYLKRGPSIIQIKGPHNQAPAAEHLPFIQDFVKSGKWSDIQDLENAGMWRNPKTGQYHTKAEAEADEALGAAYDSRNLDENGNFIGRRN